MCGMPHHEWYPLPLFRGERYVGGEEVGCQGQGVGQGGALKGGRKILQYLKQKK